MACEDTSASSRYETFWAEPSALFRDNKLVIDEIKMMNTSLVSVFNGELSNRYQQLCDAQTTLDAETSPAVRQALNAQLSQHSHLLALPIPPFDSVGRSALPQNTAGPAPVGNQDLFKAGAA